MGLNFSIAFNAYMKKLISEKRIEFTVSEIPNTCLRKAIKNADKEYEDNTKDCTDRANGDIKAAANCQAPYIKAREEKKADCLQMLINCMK